MFHSPERLLVAAACVVRCKKTHMLRTRKSFGKQVGCCHLFAHSPHPPGESKPKMDSTNGSMSSGESGLLAYDVGFQTLALCLLRAIFYFFCRHYVNSSLFSNLRSVISQDTSTAVADALDQDGIALDELERGQIPTRSTGGSCAPHAGLGGMSRGKRSSVDNYDGLLSPGKGTGRKDSSGARALETLGGGAQARTVLAKRQNHLYPTLSTGVFCLSFSESCMLFTLVLFGDVLGEK